VLTFYQWLATFLPKCPAQSDQELHAAITDGLRTICQSQLAALAVPAAGQRFRLSGISPPATINRHSDLVVAIERVIGEAVRQVPADSDMHEMDLSAMESVEVRRLQESLRAGHLHGIFIWSDRGILAACLLACRKQPSAAERWMFPTICRTLGSLLRLREQARPALPYRWFQKVIEPVHRHKSLAMGLLVAVLIAALMIPVPLRMSCDCVVQPKKRRFISVPYDGRLEEVLVEPGDLVTAGQTVARMDAHEIQLELNALDAEYHRTRKQRDSAVVGRDTAASQIAAWELERLKLQRQQLLNRMQYLDIKSPIAGVVISGDPRKFEGARFAMGQTLAEVGQLEDSLFEVSVADDDITRAHVGAAVKIKLSATPGITFRGELERIHPRAEQREGRNVFIAEARAASDEVVELRPGMNGTAKIFAGRYPLVWTLFRKAWQHAVYRIGW
jgi:hypothetical protein